VHVNSRVIVLVNQGIHSLILLSTWPGQKNEMWSPAHGIMSVLHSIQSMLSPNPYTNEPTYEHNTEEDKQKAYRDKIKHETIQISILNRLEEAYGEKSGSSSQHPLTRKQQILELCKRRFQWYFDFYHDTIDRESMEHTDQKQFELADFETTGSNGMTGMFNYAELRSRLNILKSKVDKEIEKWIADGSEAISKEKPLRDRMLTDFNNIDESLPDVTLRMPDKGNPFVWEIDLIGAMDSLLEGSLIKVRIIISQHFPDEQPYVKVLTPLFHHCIAKDGTFAYMVEGDHGKLINHVASIIKAFVDTNFDQRVCANVEASNLLWGLQELDMKPNRKEYQRKMRRSAQQG
jgi:ubiquitin-conjugating enzyme E2 Z